MMGACTYALVSFPHTRATENYQDDWLCKLAKRHLDSGKYEYEDKDFLEAISSGAGYFDGRKGGAFSWAVEANYFSGKYFVECLESFWIDLLGHEKFFEDRRILVFEEYEQAHETTVFQISLNKHPEIKLEVQTFKCPFTWISW